ncbi:hypothetical protein POM88_005654 [Heracleum sosnowskyi]|uniref:Uncharacterized protein n=1 Tax=Heracleum sosnowskyi TaxID=360622 RepID=A0AAD8N4M5_9APIA|nr:hypothetical protein POM88_005654 [Heracleum sosnowskyi]
MKSRLQYENPATASPSDVGKFCHTYCRPIPLAVRTAPTSSSTLSHESYGAGEYGPGYHVYAHHTHTYNRPTLGSMYVDKLMQLQDKVSPEEYTRASLHMSKYNTQVEMFLAYDDTQRVHLLRKDMRNEESSLGDGLGEGHGMLGQAGSGMLRISVGQNKLAAKVAKKFKERSFGSGATSGLTSVFQLRAPAARAPKPRTPKPQLHLWVLERAGEKRAAEEREAALGAAEEREAALGAAEEREAALEAAAEREAALEVEWERRAEWDMEAEWERQ